MAILSTDINPYSIMSVASMVIALMAFVASLIMNRREESHGYIERVEERCRDLQRQIEKLEKDLIYCRARVDDLLKENLVLLRKLAGTEGNEKLPKDN